MKAFGRPVTGLLLVAVLSSVNGDDIKHPTEVLFSDSECAESVTSLYFRDVDDTVPACTANEECDEGMRLYCVADEFAYAASTFGKSPYLVAEIYSDDDEGCATQDSIFVYLADGKCHEKYKSSFIATLNGNGSAVVVEYKDTLCKELGEETTLPKDKLDAHDCITNTKYYAFNAATTASNTSTSTGTSAAAPELLTVSLVSAFLGGLALVLL